MNDPRFYDADRLRAAVRQWRRECGRRTQQRRIALKFKQRQIANACDVTVQTISKIELGEIVPKDELRLKIAGVLMCEVDDIWPYPTRSDIWAQARAVA